MNLTEAINEVRSVVDDPLIDNQGLPAQSLKYTDATIVTALERKLQSLSRIQNSRDVGYNNFSLVLGAGDATQILQNVWQWSLPYWVANVSQVWMMNLGGPLNAITQPTFSPYLWATPPTMNTEPMPRARKNYPSGWRYEGNRTFRVWNQATAPNMLLQVAKTPSRLFRGTLDQDPTAKNTLYLPASLSLGVPDLEEGGYINCEIQVTSANTLENVGLRRRCVYSANQNIDDRRTTIIYAEIPFTQQLETGDTIESAMPLADEHCHLLTLLAAQWCFELTANIPAQKGIADDLRMELADFTKYVSPRDTQGPEFFQSGPMGYGPGYDPDRAYFNYRGIFP